MRGSPPAHLDKGGPFGQSEIWKMCLRVSSSVSAGSDSNIVDRVSTPLFDNGKCHLMVCQAWNVVQSIPYTSPSTVFTIPICRKPIKKFNPAIRHVRADPKHCKSAGIAPQTQAPMNEKLQVAVHGLIRDRCGTIIPQGQEVTLQSLLLNAVSVCATAAVLCDHGVRALEQGGRIGRCHGGAACSPGSQASSCSAGLPRASPCDSQ